MSDTERSLRESLASMVAISKKESSMLAAFESLGRVIEDLKCDIRSKDYRIADLEKQIDELERRAKDVQN